MNWKGRDSKRFALFWDSVLEFVWSDWIKPGEATTIVVLQTEAVTRDLQYTQ